MAVGLAPEDRGFGAALGAFGAAAFAFVFLAGAFLPAFFLPAFFADFLTVCFAAFLPGFLGPAFLAFLALRLLCLRAAALAGRGREALRCVFAFDFFFFVSLATTNSFVGNEIIGIVNEAAVIA